MYSAWVDSNPHHNAVPSAKPKISTSSITQNIAKNKIKILQDKRGPELTVSYRQAICRT
jgi:hypothetical protein